MNNRDKNNNPIFSSFDSKMNMIGGEDVKDSNFKTIFTPPAPKKNKPKKKYIKIYPDESIQNERKTPVSNNNNNNNDDEFFYSFFKEQPQPVKEKKPRSLDYPPPTNYDEVISQISEFKFLYSVGKVGENYPIDTFYKVIEDNTSFTLNEYNKKISVFNLKLDENGNLFNIVNNNEFINVPKLSIAAKKTSSKKKKANNNANRNNKITIDESLINNAKNNPLSSKESRLLRKTIVKTLLNFLKNTELRKRFQHSVKEEFSEYGSDFLEINENFVKNYHIRISFENNQYFVFDIESDRKITISDPEDPEIEEVDLAEINEEFNQRGKKRKPDTELENKKQTIEFAMKDPGNKETSTSINLAENNTKTPPKQDDQEEDFFASISFKEEDLLGAFLFNTFNEPSSPSNDYKFPEQKNLVEPNLSIDKIEVKIKEEPVYDNQTYDTQTTLPLNIIDIRKAAFSVRDHDNSNVNCVRLALKMIEYFSTGKEPVEPAHLSAVPIEQFAFFSQITQVPVIKSEGTDGGNIWMPTHTSLSRHGLFENHIPVGHEVHIDLETGKTENFNNIDWHSRPLIYFNDLNNVLQKEAEENSSKISFGIVSIYPCGNCVQNDAHIIVYYATPNIVHYIDCQNIKIKTQKNGGILKEGEPIFNNLKDNYIFAENYRSKHKIRSNTIPANVRSNNVFYVPMGPKPVLSLSLMPITMNKKT